MICIYFAQHSLLLLYSVLEILEAELYQQLYLIYLIKHICTFLIKCHGLTIKLTAPNKELISQET